MRMRAAWPLTLQMKVSKVDFALSIVNACRRRPFFCRNRRALLFVMADPGAVAIRASSGTELDAGAKNGSGTVGSRSTVSANVAPICKGEELGIVDDADMVRGIVVCEGLTSVLTSVYSDKGGVGSFLNTGKDLLKVKAENLSEERTLLLWSRGTEEGVAATETWTSLSCCCLFPTGTGHSLVGVLVRWLAPQSY